jgi:uncharacterized ion transporter superfamily protein YfcC
MTNQSADITIDIASLPVSQEPLETSEENIFNLVFKNSVPPELQKQLASTTEEQKQEKPVVQKSLSPRLTFVKKLLLAIILASIILIHAITPISSLLKSLTTSFIGIGVIIVYIILCYFAVDFVY